MEPRYPQQLTSVDVIQSRFAAAGYVCSQSIATTLYLAAHLDKPVLVEGPAGVGKTELGKVTATCLEVPLIRLQCYEGLDEAKALYEWQYGKQLLYTQILKDKLQEVLDGATGLAASMDQLHQHDDVFFSPDFLEPRPLLSALQQPAGAVLLIDEVDKSDQEFEAFLLEILSDFQVSVPEIGTIRATTRPFVFLTSNNTRELSEALKRRCLHLYINFPEPRLEQEIIQVRVPELAADLRRQLVAFVQGLRELDLKKVPSISETIDWARVLLLLNAASLTPALIRETLNVLLKFEEDIEAVRSDLPDLARRITRES